MNLHDRQEWKQPPPTFDLQNTGRDIEAMNF